MQFTDKCLFEIPAETTSGTDCRTSAGVPVMLHRHYACSTFYCPYPERMCGVRMQVQDEITRLHGKGGF